MVLGLAMASAIWLPNMEFIFGLTGELKKNNDIVIF